MEHQQQPVIRVVKKKHAHGGHHGGSWKVAYADFVTAMMAFFLVMWIISMDQPVREQIQNYFNDPASASNSKAGISRLAAGGLSPLASGFVGAMDGRGWQQVSQDAQQERFGKVRERIQQRLAGRPDLSRLSRNVDVAVTENGLKVELLEDGDSLFFDSGSAHVPGQAREVLRMVAAELGKLANPVVIEGHTDVVPYAGRANYSNWELSADRANAARRILETSGLRSRQVLEVRGYADSRLRDPEHPRDASNRRVSIMVRFGDGEAEPEAGKPGHSGHGAERKPFQVDIDPMHIEDKHPPSLKVQPHL